MAQCQVGVVAVDGFWPFLQCHPNSALLSALVLALALVLPPARARALALVQLVLIPYVHCGDVRWVHCDDVRWVRDGR